jgi:hypothetical protein
MPLIALVAIIGLVGLLALLVLVIYINRVNFKHWLLERQVATKSEEEAAEQLVNECSALVPRGPWMNSLPKGLTEAYILYNMYEQDVLSWVNKHIQVKLYEHPMKITLQWSAGPDYIPLWKQVKEYGFGVKHFVVIVTLDILKNHWPEMSKKGGVENLSKFVLVLMGTKKKDLPKDLLRLRCPCLEWPEAKPKLTSLQRQRAQFWKHLRVILKDFSD